MDDGENSARDGENDAEKGEQLVGEIDRGVSFETVVVAIESGGLLEISTHPNPAKYPGQRVRVVARDGYVYRLPFVEEDDCFFPQDRHPQSQDDAGLSDTG